MKNVISLLSIDKITKNQVLTNRKEFKRDINTLRITINHYRQGIKENPFMSLRTAENSVLDMVDALMAVYNITQITITTLLQIERAFLSNLRRQCDRVLFTGATPTLLKDRIVYVNMIKMELMTVKQVALRADVNVSTVYDWLRNDKEFGLHLDKAIAFRHAKI